MTYAEKLKDPRWQKKRLEIMQRDEWMCVECCSTESTLHVHHKVYEKGKEPWDYDDSLLVTLCCECHQAEEKHIQEYGAVLIDTLKRSPFMADDWREIAWGIHKMEAFDECSFIMARVISWALKNKDLMIFLKGLYSDELRKEIKNEEIF